MSKNKPRKHNKLQQIQENLTNKDGRNKDGKERVVIKRRLDVKINLRDGIKIRTINNKRRDRRRDMKLMSKYKVRVLHFVDDEILKRPDLVEKAIRDEIEATTTRRQ